MIINFSGFSCDESGAIANIGNYKSIRRFNVQIGEAILYIDPGSNVIFSTKPLINIYSSFVIMIE